jgi:hypothetical protein
MTTTNAPTAEELAAARRIVATRAYAADPELREAAVAAIAQGLADERERSDSVERV